MIIMEELAMDFKVSGKELCDLIVFHKLSEVISITSNISKYK